VLLLLGENGYDHANESDNSRDDRDISPSSGPLIDCKLSAYMQAHILDGVIRRIRC
jgi:hypothetical protein